MKFEFIPNFNFKMQDNFEILMNQLQEMNDRLYKLEKSMEKIDVIQYQMENTMDKIDTMCNMINDDSKILKKINFQLNLQKFTKTKFK